MKNLYLTAILPHLALTEQIDEIRNECANLFGVKKALKPPVYITLFMPFKLESEREDKVVKLLNTVMPNHNPFEINLENFDCFNTHTVFIKVLKNKNLINLQHHISGIYNRNKVDPQEVKSNTSFNPHITIAYRDILPDVFPKIWNEYKNKKFKRSFITDRFSLLKHNGEKWEVYKEFLLKEGNIQVSLF